MVYLRTVAESDGVKCVGNGSPVRRIERGEHVKTSRFAESSRQCCCAYDGEAKFVMVCMQAFLGLFEIQTNVPK